MNEHEKIKKENIQDIYALTPVQEGMLYHYLSNLDSSLYFEQISFEIIGPLDVECMKQAWKSVIDQNEMLRTVFRWEKIKKPVQLILKKVNLPLTVYDISGEINRAFVLEEIKKKDLKKRIDISAHPFRILLVKLDERKYEIILSSYHIIFDGWSNGIILKEVLDAYNTYSQGRQIKIKTKTKYKEFIKWMMEQHDEEHESYWKEYLNGFEQRTYLLSARKNDVIEDAIGVQSYIQTLPLGLAKSAVDYSNKNKITLASLLFYAWGVLLRQYTKSDDVVFGTTVSGRSAGVSGIQDMVGLFINTIPLRITFDQEKEIGLALKNINSSIAMRSEHEHVSLTKIKDVSQIKDPGDLFNSILVIENYPLGRISASDGDEIDISLSSIFEMTNYDITLVISTMGELSLRFLYDSNVYNETLIVEVSEHYHNILKEITEHSVFDVDLINMLSPYEKKHILEDFNSNKFDYNRTQTITEKFERQAQSTPERVALQYAGETISYGELNRKANQFASYLRRRKVKKEEVVGLMMERSIDLYISILGVLKAGAAYLPIDVETPVDRVDYMLRDASVRLLFVKGNEISEFTTLQGFANSEVTIVKTPLRPPISNFDELLMPDRSLIDISKYKNKIGMASVNNCISLQTTRGCPYECLYCHKIWSKKHVRRSPENLFSEFEYYYKNGVRNFAVIDDCFNLDLKGSSEILKLLIKNNMKIQLFFPNGLRGDILTRDYIDLMIESGTKGINLSLETASPRLQKLLKKNLNLDKFRENAEYIAVKHPEIILEMASMHGFPTETEEEAYMTLNFMKDIKWIHFPYIHILKIYPNTEMEKFALENGISKYDINISRNRAFHELPETLPFSKNFTRKYQSSFMNDYFLQPERLMSVLPVQIKILDESALIQKYNAYLPTEINCIEDLIQLAGITNLDIAKEQATIKATPSIFNRSAVKKKPLKGTMKVLLLDLSQHFSGSNMLYKVAEQPLGQIYLMTYLKQQFKERIDGRVVKSGIDFDNYTELKAIVDEFKPDIIGIRTLTYYREFFHQTVSILRQWEVNIPIITGGPYATSDYDTLLKDYNIDLVMHGEGELIWKELVEKMLKNDFLLPDHSELKKIQGVSFRDEGASNHRKEREVLIYDQLEELLKEQETINPPVRKDSSNLAYVMYTSGSTGKPKGVMIEDRQVNNCISWMQKEFRLQQTDKIIQRTNSTFDPSVWEFLWPLYVGGQVEILTAEQAKDAQFLIDLLRGPHSYTVLYCPASMIEGMTYLLTHQPEQAKLKLKYLFIGAEAISRKTIHTFYHYFEGKIVNTYGPTECTINNTYAYLNREEQEAVVPIGRPVGNNKIYIVSDSMQVVPIQLEGEICIAGDSVGRGYINDPQKTVQSFINNPFGEGKLYRTGDVGRWKADGEIEILGRADEQVKIRGYRIELGEIESALLKHPHIRQSIVTINDNKKRIMTCKACGLTTEYSNVTVNDDGVCNICESQEKYLFHINKYFKELDDLKQLLLSSRRKEQKYDCILMFSGSLGSIYALDRLLEMGIRVLTFTFDNGYMPKSDLVRVKEMTKNLGVDHISMTYENTDQVLATSCEVGSTVCRGCFHLSTALSRDYAFKNNIPIVIGSTLSRGQIIENKLMTLIEQGIKDENTIDRELLLLQKNTKILDSEIFAHINIDSLNEDVAYEQVKNIDFYRYCNVTNKEMIADIYKKKGSLMGKKDRAIYSTNCPIKQIGDRIHLMKKNHHYYGKATSWEKRLAHITREDVDADLHCHVSEDACKKFAKRIGYKWIETKEALDQKYINAYYVADKSLEPEELKEYLKKSLPAYMMPSYFIPMECMKFLPNGKIDKKSLPEPGLYANSSAELVLPTNEIEEKLSEIWRDVLGIDKVGITSNFFDIGGNSILLIQLFSQIGKFYPNKISMTDLFAYTTISQMAECIKGQDAGAQIQTSLKLPKDYFVTTSSHPVTLEGVLDKEAEKLWRFSENSTYSVPEILRSIFLYVLHELSGQNKIMACTNVGEGILPIHVDFENMKGFEDLFHKVKNWISQGEGLLPGDAVRELKWDVDAFSIFPFIHFGEADYELLTRNFDLIINIESSHKVPINCVYNYKKLNKSRVKELFQRFMDLIQVVLDTYEKKHT